MLRELEDGNLGMSAELGSTGKTTEGLRRPGSGTNPQQEQGGRPWEALRRASTAAAGGVLNPALVGQPHRGVRVLGTARSAGARTFARKLKQAGPGLGYRSPQPGVLQAAGHCLFWQELCRHTRGKRSCLMLVSVFMLARSFMPPNHRLFISVCSHLASRTKHA